MVSISYQLQSYEVVHLSVLKKHNNQRYLFLLLVGETKLLSVIWSHLYVVLVLHYPLGMSNFLSYSVIKYKGHSWTAKGSASYLTVTCFCHSALFTGE